MDQFAPKLAEDYITRRKHARTRQGRMLSGGTVAKEIKAMFGRAVVWREIETHPFLRVSTPSDLRAKVPSYYTPEQLAALYAADVAYGSIWQFMVNTGLRRGEALKAMRQDIACDSSRLYF